MKELKSAIYIRVSTDAQREEGYSIDAQKEMLAAYCVSKGIKNYEYYIDGGFTGSNLDRPELQRLIADVKNKEIEKVIVYKLDRLSRSQKDTLYLIEDVFNPYTVDFVSMNESMDTATPLGRLMLGILSAFAQLERENIRERTRMGMKERIKLGYWMGGGRIPFGYDYDKVQGILIPNKDADTVRQIYELYLKGYSTGRIAHMLGLKYERLAIQILMRKSNCGVICYNGEEYMGKHEPIISLETYQKAMDCMQERSVNRTTESNYLLTGLLQCGKCGAKMRYQKWGKHDCKIVCYSQDHSKPNLVKNPDCDNERLWASDIEDVVIKDLFAFALSNSLEEDNGKMKENIFDVLNTQYNEISKKLKRLYHLYSESGDEILMETIEETRKTLSGIQKQIEIENERNVLLEKAKSVQKILSTIQETWEYMEQKEKKNIMRSCIDRVVIAGHRVEVFYKFKLLAENATTANEMKKAQ